ncbi:MAG: 50S ribosomal protein L4 [Desulfobulbaceae bacterium]|uniref:Large ribosomal subunit protein uL4 n=1 Tax=Candidatus Desulfobia pelagia TaxID=2841692 RepID=A0A8J6NEF7_9BACT|nr:50S ribosomal protein L4 [Candidatus Desulfobia pelagia]
MAVSTIVNMKNEKVGEMDLNDSLFGVEVRPYVLHDIVKMQMANRRAGTACTKTRAEVRGSSAKPYRQKGTGRARAGSRRSPVWRGGGTTFGPKPRSYAYKLPKKVRKLGLRMALSARMAEERLCILDEFKLDAIKTKNFIGIMKTLELDNALIVVPSHDDVLERSSRNVPGFKVLPSAGLNVYDILLHKNVILLQSTIGQLEERLLS